MAVEQLTPLESQQRANMDAIFSPNKRVSKDPAQRHTSTQYRAMEKQIKMMKADRPVTLLNLNPTSLKINGGMFFPEEIPACPLDEPYVIHVFRETRWGHLDKGCDLNNVHTIDPFPATPMVIAAEYMRVYVQETDGFGGVICYVGDHHPSTIKKGAMVTVPVVSYVDGELVMEEEERDFHELLGIVRKRRNVSLIGQIQKANSWHENLEQNKNVNDVHRDMARLAFKEGIIPELPRWVLQASMSMEKQPDPCPSCMEIPKSGAILCVNCNHTFSPLEAYRQTRIAYGAVEMDRMTSEEWKIADQIKAERDKRRAGRGVVAQ